MSNLPRALHDLENAIKEERDPSVLRALRQRLIDRPCGPLAPFSPQVDRSHQWPGSLRGVAAASQWGDEASSGLPPRRLLPVAQGARCPGVQHPTRCRAALQRLSAVHPPRPADVLSRHRHRRWRGAHLLAQRPVPKALALADRRGGL